MGNGCGYGDWNGMRFPAAVVVRYNTTFVVPMRSALRLRSWESRGADRTAAAMPAAFAG